MNKCYRVWFGDGSAVLVDAEDEAKARKEALSIARPRSRVVSAECLDNGGNGTEAKAKREPTGGVR